MGNKKALLSQGLLIRLLRLEGQRLGDLVGDRVQGVCDFFFVFASSFEFSRFKVDVTFADEVIVEGATNFCGFAVADAFSFQFGVADRTSFVGFDFKADGVEYGFVGKVKSVAAFAPAISEFVVDAGDGFDVFAVEVRFHFLFPFCLVDLFVTSEDGVDETRPNASGASYRGKFDIFAVKFIV